MRSFDLTTVRTAFRSAPLAWVGALAVAALPAVALALKPAPAPTPVTPASASRADPVGTVGAPARASDESAAVSLSNLFGGADSPFLTEEQARERRFRGALAKVEEVLRRRPDVRDVTVLATASQDGKSPVTGAVVTVHMREGVVPVTLVDAVGTLVSAAVPGLKAGDVTVIDESTGIRAKAVALDDAQSQDGRRALAAAAERQVPTPAKAVTPVVVAASDGAAVGWPAWAWAGVGAGGVALALAGWAAFHRRRLDAVSDVVPAAEDPIAGTLAMALHRCVAEQGALVTTALVERLEQGASANEVAQLLLNLEPWAAERLLKGMPPEALAKVEEALRDPATDAPMASVRALAEAVLGVRAAA